MEIPCPVCGTKVKVKCPFFFKCKYRQSGLGLDAICFRHPEMCTFFKRQGGVSELNIKFNPSKRDGVNESK